MNTLPWTHDVRADTGTTNVRLGMWLFLASEAMFFASLVSAYVLLRTRSASWPDAWVLGNGTQASAAVGRFGWRVMRGGAGD